MEHADWIQGFDTAQARFLMVTAITHHWISSPVWGRARGPQAARRARRDRRFCGPGRSTPAIAMAAHLAEHPQSLHAASATLE